MITTRRRFLSLLGLGAAAAGVELVAPEPVRRWFVPRNAPFASRWEARGDAWAESPAKLCSCTSPWCNLLHARKCAGCGAAGPCPCALKAMRFRMQRFDPLTERDANGVGRDGSLFGIDAEGWDGSWIGEPTKLTHENYLAGLREHDRRWGERAEPETSWELPDTPENRAYLKDVQTAEYQAKARELLERDPIAQALIRARSSLEDQVYGSGFQFSTMAELAEPIGTVESYDPETGLATVRLGKPLVGWRGTGVA